MPAKVTVMPAKGTVMPAKAGIQLRSDPGLRRGD
jgi:hypothetical protein